MRCVDACPNQAIIPLDKTFGLRLQSTPAIKARRQACMLCNKIDGDYLKCTEACPTGADRYRSVLFIQQLELRRMLLGLSICREGDDSGAVGAAGDPPGGVRWLRLVRAGLHTLPTSGSCQAWSQI
jgi:hypothetical protein